MRPRRKHLGYIAFDRAGYSFSYASMRPRRKHLGYLVEVVNEIVTLDVLQ